MTFHIELSKWNTDELQEYWQHLQREYEETQTKKNEIMEELMKRKTLELESY